MSNLIAVAKVDEVKPGQLKAFDIDDKSIVIANWEGTLFAAQNVCTHDNGTLSDGEIIDGAIECPRHGARFDLHTGRGTLPAPRPIKTFPVKVENDTIFVSL